MLIVTRHPAAPLRRGGGRLPARRGFLAAHWLPHWSSQRPTPSSSARGRPSVVAWRRSARPRADAEPSCGCGGAAVRRALPQRGRRTVGAWCFVDHFGPVGQDLAAAMQVGPHPHIGLQTVTWLLEGEVLHTDSLGSEQVIRPGQLNLMTAGVGRVARRVRPRERPRRARRAAVGALPDETRSGPGLRAPRRAPAGRARPGDGDGARRRARGVRSPARAAHADRRRELELRRGAAVVPVEPGWEHAVVVLAAAVSIEGRLSSPAPSPMWPGRRSSCWTPPRRRGCSCSAASPSARRRSSGGTSSPARATRWSGPRRLGGRRERHATERFGAVRPSSPASPLPRSRSG